ncbi:MAG: hypothetical protein JW959_11830 [Pirellulales bacterium]|nr:hypothetical protein [Pirellulales bacterium]
MGIADRYKAGLWTPVEVFLSGGEADVDGELSLIAPDGDDVPGRVSTPCRIAAGTDKTVAMIARLGRVRGYLTVEFRADGRTVLRRRFETAERADGAHFLPALEFRKLYVVVGESDLGLTEAGRIGGAEPEHRPVVARIDDLRRLPDRWFGYEGVDAVFISTARPEIFRGLNDARAEALDKWIRMGGRLVLSAGARSEQAIGGRSPLARFLPGRFEKMESLRQASALEAYCGSRIGIMEIDKKSGSMRVPRLAEARGRIEAAEADLPLVVRAPRSFGQILFLAGDLDEQPLSGWADRPLLADKLLDSPRAAAEEAGKSSAMMHFGYKDLSGQMRSALDRFHGVNPAPFWLVAGAIVVYLLLIGPGDFFFLRKYARRMGWTWLTFSLIVVLAGLAAYLLARQLKGNKLRVNQIALIDVDAAGGLVRGAAWMNVFSPRTETFDFSVRPEAAEARVLTAWLGLSGGGLGGMDPRTAAAAPRYEGFRYASDLDAMLGVPIQVWSSKSLTARWEAPAAACLAADLTAVDRLLYGTITNTLDFPLEKCLLAYGQSAYQIDALEPGKPFPLGMMTKRSELKTVLTGRKVKLTEGDKYRQEATPYDQASTDLFYILRTMMFYKASGGRRYTGLWNEYQGFVDLSDLLKAGRAILIVQGPADDNNRRAATLRDGDESLGEPNDEHRVMYRFVFPVKEGNSG